AAAPVIEAFAAEVGAKHAVGNHPDNYLFQFSRKLSKEESKDLWVRVRRPKYPQRYRVRKNTEAGKALAARIAALPEFPDLDTALEIYPGFPGPLFIGGRYAHSAAVCYFDKAMKVAGIVVPFP